MAAISDAEMLVLFNEALQAVSTGASYEINDRRLTRADLSDIMRTIEWLERRIGAASDTTGGVMLVRYQEPQ